jgi:chemotaxis protein methyltransferase CheR
VATSKRRAAPKPLAGLEELEITLLLDGIERRYGFDFRQYAAAPLRRRILESVRSENARTVSGLQERLLHDPSCFERLVTRLAVNVTSLFREPTFYRSFRDRVAPAIRDHPKPRLWLMGCATGEELYSMAVMLREEGLERAQVYATDIHEAPLQQAASGSFPLQKLRSAESGYRAAGGRGSLSEYYAVDGGRGVFREELRRNVVFASHNFATDASFNQFEIILSRAVLPYLGPSLQSRVHRLFYDSLPRAGFLALGRGADLKPTPLEPRYETVDGDNGLYQKRR